MILLILEVVMFIYMYWVSAVNIHSLLWYGNHAPVGI